MADGFDGARELYKWNRFAFSLMGVWPLDSTYVTFTISIVYLLIHMCMEFCDFYYVFGDLEVMIFNLAELTLEIMVLAKLIVLRFSGTLVNVMNRIIDSIDAKYFDNTEEMEIYLSFNHIAKTFYKLWIIMGFFESAIYHMKPLEFRIRADLCHKPTILVFCFVLQTELSSLALSNESMPFVLPYRTRLSFEVNDSTTFWLVWTCQTPMVYVHMFHSVTIGYLFTLILHVCGQLSVLSFRIRNINPISDDNRKAARRIFRDIINRHRSILGIANDIESVFHILLLEEIFVSTVIVGLSSYSVIVNATIQKPGVFVSFLMYDVTVLLLIYGYCAAGEYLITESTNLSEAYYQCQWYDLSESFKKQLIICMIGANKPMQLTAGGFYIFSMFGFTSILKTAAGYTSLLRTMH